MTRNPLPGLSRRTAVARIGTAGAGLALAAGLRANPAAAQAGDHPLLGAWILGAADDPVGTQVAAFLAGGLVLVSAVESANSDVYGDWTATDAAAATLALASISRDPAGNPVQLRWSGGVAVDGSGALTGSVQVVAIDGNGGRTELGTLDYVGTRIAAGADAGTPEA
jgi:hypothetical protein